ncbi:unnamed protein product [Adineta steineri]|uniref:NHL repeat containing protein-like protein n=1 Tax=Adineta steineri TaxID=433720 RepID=A0A814SHX8_9BILA|nr:unnamed protein product [Adineta steineri]CAF3962238.1 unnamed protein product [Adineta steineri]
MSALSICPTAVWSLNATTVAGSSEGIPGSTLTLLYTPITVIGDNSSNIYVADTGNYRVLQFPANSTTGILRINGSFGTGFNQFSAMTDMGMDANGNIYVLDGTLARVTKWTPGSTSGILAAGGGPFNDYFDGHVDSMSQPGGMFIEPQSMFIWITDTNNSRIVKWVNSSTALTVCGSYGSNSNQFISPKGLFVDTTANNTLYVVDSGNHRVQMWLPGATSGITVAGITGYYGTGLNQLWNPLAVVVDSNQNMYIADVKNNRILQWKVGASFGVSIAGTILYNPSGISFDPNGSLFVADTNNNRVQRFAIYCPINISTTTISSVVATTMPISNSNCAMTVWALNATTIAGSPIGIAGFTSTLLNSPADILVGKNDSVYVMDYGTSYYRMQVFYPGSQSGTTIFNATFGTGLNQFSTITAFNIDVSGNIYILDAGNSRVTEWAPGASTGILVAGGHSGRGSSLNVLNAPSDFFVEPNTSYIWIADTNDNRIVKWIDTSTAILVAGGAGSGSQANQFNYPTGLFVDTSDSNTLYVADSGNHRIQKWLYGASNGTTVAGTGVSGSALNQLNSPATLIMGTNGSMYIVDYGNHRIVLWLLGSTSGIVIAGSDTHGVLPSQLYYPFDVRLDSTGALIVNDYSNNRIQRFPVLCSPNTTSSSTTSVLTNSTSIAATLQNTTTAVPFTTKSLTTSASNPTTIQSASTSIANSVTVSATVSTSAIITPSTIPSTSSVVTPSTTVSASAVLTPSTTVSASAVVTPSTPVSTSPILTPSTTVSASAIGTSSATLTPSATLSTSTIGTSSTKVSTSAIITPSITVSTSPIVTPSTTVSMSPIVTPSTIVSTSAIITPSATPSTSPIVTRSTTVSASAIVTPSTTVSTSTIVTPSTTVSTSTLVATSQNSSSTNTITKLSSTTATSSLSANHSFATRNLNSKLLVLLFCSIMIFMNN